MGTPSTSSPPAPAWATRAWPTLTVTFSSCRSWCGGGGCARRARAWAPPRCPSLPLPLLLLLLLLQGALLITTEFGRLHVAPGEICVVQRGMRFRCAAPAAALPSRTHAGVAACTRAPRPPRPLQRGAAGRSGTRVRARGVWRALSAARPGAHRLQRPGQRARFSDPVCMVRGPRLHLHCDPQAGGRALLRC